MKFHFDSKGRCVFDTDMLQDDVLMKLSRKPITIKLSCNLKLGRNDTKQLEDNVRFVTNALNDIRSVAEPPPPDRKETAKRLAIFLKKEYPAGAAWLTVRDDLIAHGSAVRKKLEKQLNTWRFLHGEASMSGVFYQEIEDAIRSDAIIFGEQE